MRREFDKRLFTSTEAAWLAGLIDGDGTITLVHRHRNEHRQLEVGVSNTDLALLKAVKSIIGMGRITRKRTTSRDHTTCGTYMISNRQALAVLAEIQPFLRTYKSKRAKLVLENYVRLTPRNGYYTDELLSERGRFIEEFLDLNPNHDKRNARRYSK